MKQQAFADNCGTNKKELHRIRHQSQNANVKWVVSLFTYLKTTDVPIRSKNYGIESECRADKHHVSHVKSLVYKFFNKKHSIVDTNAKTQTRFALMTMHDVSKYKKSNPNCFQEIRQRTSVYEILVYNPRPQ